MDDRCTSSEISIRERELRLKEKELELRERELQLEELKAQKGKQNKVMNAVKGEAFKFGKEKLRNPFSLRDEDNTKIFSDDGILGRKGYWFFWIPYTAVCLVYLSVFGAYLDVARYSGSNSGITFLLVLILLLILFILSIPGLFANIKRCRDCDISFWWIVLFAFVPIAECYLLFANSKVDLNKYSKQSSDYLKSEEYLRSKKSARTVVYAILFVNIVFIVMAINAQQ